MKKSAIVKLALAAAAFGVAMPAMASADLAKKNRCMSCHAVDKKMIGPSFKDIAAKYKGQAAAPAQLAVKVKKGGTGVWGKVPMPPNAAVSDADTKTLVAWVLATK